MTSVMTPSSPSEPGDQAEEVVAGAVQVPAAEAHHLAVDHHHLDAQDIVGGEAVFQAVHAARVLRDVAADRAGDLAGGIGRVIHAAVGDRIADGEVGDAWLHHGAAVVLVDLQNAVELAEAEQDTVLKRQRAARQGRSRAARHHADLLLAAIFQDSGDLFHGLRQHHHHGHLPVGGEAVALIGTAAALLVDHALAGHDLPQRRNDLAAAGKHLLVELRHLQHG